MSSRRSSATRAIVVDSASRYCGSRNSGYGGTSTGRTTARAKPADRKGGSLLMRCTLMAAEASACASSVATTPLPPTDA